MPVQKPLTKKSTQKIDQTQISEMVNTMMLSHKKEQEKEFQNVKDELKEIKQLLAHLVPKLPKTPSSQNQEWAEETQISEQTENDNQSGWIIMQP